MEFCWKCLRWMPICKESCESNHRVVSGTEAINSPYPEPEFLCDISDDETNPKGSPRTVVGCSFSLVMTLHTAQQKLSAHQKRPTEICYRGFHHISGLISRNRRHPRLSGENKRLRDELRDRGIGKWSAIGSSMVRIVAAREARDWFQQQCPLA